MKGYGIYFAERPVKVFATGKCGESMEWVLNNGILTITGTGEMVDNFSPWYTYSSIIKKLIIDEGVLSIGDYAFYNCYELREVLLPRSIKRIGSYAFYSCTSLRELRIPDSIDKVMPFAFQNCNALRILCKSREIMSTLYS